MVVPQQDVPLSLHTTFRLGGKAAFFISVQSVDELREAVLFAKEKALPFFVLGGGSNLLVSDDGFHGVIIKMEIKGVEWNDAVSVLADSATSEHVEVVMGAGENWDDIVAASVERGLTGLESLSGIPGSAGAAPVQNIGAYGAEIKDTLSWVEVFDVLDMSVKIFRAAECEFAYRDSLFKKTGSGRYVITRVACVLEKNAPPKIAYKDLQLFFANETIAQARVTVAHVRRAVLEIRHRKLPDLAVYGTAGSFFKNPVVSMEHFLELAAKFPGIPSFDVTNADGTFNSGAKKIPAAWMLDNICTFKGYREGNVGVYENQSLVLVHFGGGSARDVKHLAEQMQTCVKTHTNISLVPEVVMLGF